MSRTRRDYQTWEKWLDGFENRLRRGLVAIPKRKTLKSHRKSTEPWAEIWHPRSKRLSKQTASRKRRIRDDRIVRDLMGVMMGVDSNDEAVERE